MKNSSSIVSSHSRYLSLLGAESVQEIESRVVRCLESALEERHSKGPPVRLAPIARAFAIEPEPYLVSIDHDGEITFDESSQRFTIRLRLPQSEATLKQVGANPRYRFTYAHEMAHRFLFVKNGQTWRRALDVATEGLDAASKLREKITLSRIEEGICNGIARRVLIPDSFLNKNCRLEEWFCGGPSFYSVLTQAARACEVSRDVMLVRLERWGQASTGDHFAIIVDRSTGAVTKRGRRTLRAMAGIFPNGRRRDFYPGMPLDGLGPELEQLALKASATKDSDVRDFRLNFLLRESVAAASGWWRVIARDRFMIWGRLSQANSLAALDSVSACSK